MTGPIRVGPVEDIPPGARRIIEHEGISVGIFNVDGEFFALLNRCLHDSGPVCRGRVKRALVGTFEGPGKRVKESFTGPAAVTCPWHGWEYELETGDHVGDGHLSLPTFDVTVEDGVVYVDL